MARVSRRQLRWIVPAVALAGLIGVPQVLSSARAGADPTLPSVTAQELLTSIVSAKPVPLSGEVTQTTNLGLPSIPQLGQGTRAASNPLSLLSGTHQWRVWTNASDSSRVELVDGSSETNIVANSTDVWVYSSDSNTATHYALDQAAADHAASATPSALPSGLPSTPQQVADKILNTLDPTTTISTGRNSTIAGRSAYALILTPKTTDTKVGKVIIDVDSATFTVLRVQVYASGASTAAVDIGFTSIDFATPAASNFSYTPGPGVSVVEASDHSGSSANTGNAPSTPGSFAKHVAVSGSGWSQVVVATLPSDLTASGAKASGAGSSSGSTGASYEKLLAQLPEVSGAWGSGHLLDGTLFSVLITTDGRVALGAVPPALLYSALG